MDEYKTFLTGNTMNFAVSYHPKGGTPLEHLIRASQRLLQCLREYEEQGFVFIPKGHSLHNETIGFTATLYGIESKKNEEGKPWKELDELKFKLKRKEEEIEQLKKQIEEKNK